MRKVTATTIDLAGKKISLLEFYKSPIEAWEVYNFLMRNHKEFWGGNPTKQVFPPKLRGRMLVVDLNKKTYNFVAYKWSEELLFWQQFNIPLSQEIENFLAIILE